MGKNICHVLSIGDRVRSIFIWTFGSCKELPVKFFKGLYLVLILNETGLHHVSYKLFLGATLVLTDKDIVASKEGEIPEYTLMFR